MILFPAIDLYGGQAVRLVKGDYTQMTVYHTDPFEQAMTFARLGATHLHLVDLEGARDGTTPHLELVSRIARQTSLFTEIGGGIRSMETVGKYLNAGVDRVILGTAAITDPTFLRQAVDKYGDAIAVGADVRDGFLAVKGWLEDSAVRLDPFCEQMQSIGVKTLICTDISRDGRMIGANRQLYAELSQRYRMQITASGGVNSLADIRALRQIGLYGAIVGKAYYTGAVELGAALRVADGSEETMVK